MRAFLFSFAACAVAACGDHGNKVIYVDAVSESLADLRADSNRDGVVAFDDSDANKLDWSDKVGAVLLANIDDDNQRCHATVDDVTLPDCNDAADEIINGPDDLADLARLRTKPIPTIGAEATATLSIDNDAARDRVRLFSKTGPNDVDFTPIADTTVFHAAQLKAGIELAIEAKDIVRDPAVWDGFVDVRFSITNARGISNDVVHMRVAPVLTFHHLLAEDRVWSSNTGRTGNTAMRGDLGAACTRASVTGPSLIEDDDPWAQDFFEPAFMSMPGPGGAQHVIRVNYRSANVYTPTDAKNPLRPAGQVVFRMRGKDIAAVQQFDIKHDVRMDSLNSFGNLETVPPYALGATSYPFGRVIRGRTPTFYPDKTFERMLEAQGQQPPIFVDTSWLLVGHVDETISFVKAKTPRGWKVLVNDARLAKKMLEDAALAGHGDVTMFQGKQWENEQDPTIKTPAEVSVSAVLADTNVMQASAEAAVEVDAQLAVLKKELALADDEIISVPFLHHTVDGSSAAYQPGMVNGIAISDTHFGAPAPHGPIIDGKDIFEDAFTKALAPLGITVDYIEDWDEYHVGVGEVHCATNSSRAIPDAKWWESGR